MGDDPENVASLCQMTTPPPLPVSPSPMRPRLLAAGACLVLLAVACALPAAQMEKDETWNGAQMLGMGWLGIFIGQFGWLANPLMLLSLILLITRHPRAAVIVSLLSIAIGCHSFSLPGATIPLDEGGARKTTVLALGPAVYVWLAALAGPAAAVVLLTWKRAGGTKSAPAS